mmetsp:Transcript_21878/g.55711  ORF Transcript_21878/g.55711 Transcript_21878/m.55711 type:complete len:285 (+) Transcript_21878:503-1357(+)
MKVSTARPLKQRCEPVCPRYGILPPLQDHCGSCLALDQLGDEETFASKAAPLRRASRQSLHSQHTVHLAEGCPDLPPHDARKALHARSQSRPAEGAASSTGRGIFTERIRHQAVEPAERQLRPPVTNAVHKLLTEAAHLLRLVGCGDQQPRGRAKAVLHRHGPRDAAKVPCERSYLRGGLRDGGTLVAPGARGRRRRPLLLRLVRIGGRVVICLKLLIELRIIVIASRAAHEWLQQHLEPLQQRAGNVVQGDGNRLMLRQLPQPSDPEVADGRRPKALSCSLTP